MKRTVSWVWLATCAVSALAPAADERSPAKAEPVRIADGKLQIGLDPASGTLRELVSLPDGYNQLADVPEPLGLWQITVRDGDTSRELTAERAGPPKIERVMGDPPGLRLTWDQIVASGKEPLRVEVLVRVGQPAAALSRWELAVTKPKNVRLQQVRFPRVPALRERPEEVLAVPRELGALARNPRRLTQGKNDEGTRIAWRYPWVMAMQCLAWYQPDGPGFYAA